MKKLFMKTFLLLLMLWLTSTSLLFAEMVEWEKPEKEGKWYKIIAGYYVIWYEEKDESIALEVARVGQAMYEDFKDIFGKKSPKKVYVKIESRSGSVNGNYSPAPPTINLHTYSPYDTKGFDWNYMLLTHELLHYMHLEYKGGLIGVASALVGPVGRSILMQFTPGWGIEGFAVAVESDYTSSGRYHNPFFTMPYRADIILNNPNTYLEITRQKLADDPANYGRQYLYGVQLMNYIKERYGYEYLAKVWQKFMNFPLGYRERYKKQRPGQKFIFYEMLEHDKKKYQKYESWPRGTELQRKENDRALYSVIGASEKGVLIYQYGTDVKARYMLFNPKTLEFKKLFNSSFPAATSADISKNGKYMTYIVPVKNSDMVTSDGPIGVYNDVYTYNLETRAHKRVTKKQQLSDPVISNDGKYIYATQLTNSGRHSRLIKIALDKSKQGYEVLYEQEKSSVFEKAISPNGKRIVFEERSVEFGVKLQLFDLETKEIHTLVQRDYGLRMASPNFIDNNTISIVANLEHITENTAMYMIDFSDIQAPIWTRMGRDKVGFHSAVLSVDNEIVYSSHNSRGYSIFTYHNNEVKYYPIDFNTLPLPDYYHDNNLQRYLNKKIVENPELAPERRQPIAEGELKYKKKRVVGFLPTRPVAYFPMLSYDTSLGFALQYTLTMRGETDKSELTAQLSYYFDPVFTDIANSIADKVDYQPPEFTDIVNSFTYNLNYKYTFSKLGSITLGSTREFSNDDTDTIATWKQSAVWKRTLLYTPRNHYLSALVKTDFSNVSIISKNSSNSDLSSSLGNSLTFTLQFPFGWSSKLHLSELLSQNLSWEIAPFVIYTPPILDKKEPLYKTGVYSYIDIPIVRRLGTRLSNYTAWMSNTNGAFLGTERFRRYSGIITYPSVKSATLISGKGASTAPLQSSVTFDLLIPWGHANAGSFLFEPYKFYTNIFAEQSFGYDVDTHKFELNKYLIAGLETGVKVNIVAFSLDFKLGGAYKIPYDDTSDQGYYLYVSLGQGSISDLHKK